MVNAGQLVEASTFLAIHFNSTIIVSIPVKFGDTAVNVWCILEIKVDVKFNRMCGGHRFGIFQLLLENWRNSSIRGHVDIG